MRVNISLESKSDVEYGMIDFEYKFRGLVYSALLDSEDDKLVEIHDSDVNAFVFSNLYPPKPVIETGDVVHIDICSGFEKVGFVLMEFLEGQEIEVGEYQFKVLDVDLHQQSVGISGEFKTPNGVYLTVDDDSPYDTYWTDEDGVNVFIERVESQLDMLIDELYDDYSSEDRNFPVFESVTFRQTHARPVKISEDTTHTIIKSDWVLEYTITSELHKAYIQTAKEFGIGSKNSLGFGYLLEN